MLRGLSSNDAQTHPDHPDARLRGRSYAIAFERVWSSALIVAEEDVQGWSVQRWDDRSGTITVEGHSRFPTRVDEIQIRVTLDPNAQTRLDVRSIALKGTFDLGRSTRRIGEFLRMLDRKLGPSEEEILPAEYARTVVTHQVPAA